VGFSAVQQSLWQGMQWALENLAPYSLLRDEMIAICVLSIIIFFAVEKQKRLERPFLAALLILAASTLLSLIAYVLPASMTVVSWGHQGIILAVALSLLVALFAYHLPALLTRLASKLLKYDREKSQAGLLISVMLISLIYAPFVYSRVVMDPWTLKGAYSMFAVTWKQDDALMQWMKNNLTQDAVILVNPYECGLFIPSLANRKAVFVAVGSQLSRRYQMLFASLCNETLDNTSYKTMRSFNITHVYVGSAATFWWVKNYKWDKDLFLGNPNFRLVKNIDRAYLFEALYRESSSVFFDDFQHEHWYDYGWKVNYDGNGLGNVSISSAIQNSSQSLQITSQTVCTASTWRYSNYVSRSIFVQSNSHVSLSFDFRLTEGFNGQDTFAAIVSNANNNQSIVIATPNGVYRDYNYSRRLSTEGHWSGDLTELWREKFNTTVPSRLVLQFLNIDFDGIRNVVQIDNVNVTAIPNHNFSQEGR
jgi:hypothetical protein